MLDAAKYLVDTSESFKTEGIKVQNTWVDGISSQSSTHEEWSEFVENPSTFSADVRMNEIIINCQDWGERHRM